MDMFSIVAPNPSPASIFISTFMREHRQERVCQEDQDVCDLHSPFQTVDTREYFVAGVEQYDLLVSHEAQAFQTFTRTRDQRYVGNVSTMTGVLRQYTDDGTGRVRYVVKKSYDAGENVMMSLEEFLSMAGLTLDTVLPGYYKPIRQTVGSRFAPSPPLTQLFQSCLATPFFSNQFREGGLPDCESGPHACWHTVPPFFLSWSGAIP